MVRIPEWAAVLHLWAYKALVGGLFQRLRRHLHVSFEDCKGGAGFVGDVGDVRVPAQVTRDGDSY